MKFTILLFLGALFVINVFFRVRLMKLLNQIKKHQLQIEIKDLVNSDRFVNLIQNKYPEHAELLTKYRESMMVGLGLVILVVLGLTIYIVTGPQ